MNRKPIKLRARLKGEVTVVKALISHPMETGLRKDKKSGQTIPAHFIREVTCSHNGDLKLSLEFGISVSRDPFLEFELEGGAQGDEVALAWRDNRGESDAITTRIR